MLNLKKRCFEQINTTMEIFFFFCLINQCQIHRLLSPGFNPPQMASSSTYSRGRGVLWGPDGRRLLSLSLFLCGLHRLFRGPSILSSRQRYRSCFVFVYLAREKERIPRGWSVRVNTVQRVRCVRRHSSLRIATSDQTIGPVSTISLHQGTSFSNFSPDAGNSSSNSYFSRFS